VKQHFERHPTSFQPAQFAFNFLSVIQKCFNFFSSAKKKMEKKISRIISDNGSADVFFFCDFGSVRKFCYLFLGILKVNLESETGKNEPQKRAQKSRHFWTLASRKQGGNLFDCESQ
jgi:hypothetical protein